MSPHPFFGPLVHTVFPSLAKNPTCKPGKKRLAHLARKHGLISPKQSEHVVLSDADHTRILEVWSYIQQLISHADQAWSEPKIAGYHPDLVLLHHGKIYVIDIKTCAFPDGAYQPEEVVLPFDNPAIKSPKVRRQLVRKGYTPSQLNESAKHIRTLRPHQTVYMYHLVFGHKPGEVVWCFYGASRHNSPRPV